MVIKKILPLVLCLLFTGCATTFEPIPIPKAEFAPTEAFQFTETIQKPGKPSYFLLDDDFNEIDSRSEASYIAFTPNEFAKIVGLSAAFDEQGKVIENMSVLLNIRIEEINALKELVATKELLAEHLAQLYVNEQRIRHEEGRTFVLKDTLNKVFMVIQAGVIVALAFAL